MTDGIDKAAIQDMATAALDHDSSRITAEYTVTPKLWSNPYALAIAAGHYSVLWVCQCCMLVHANGECCDETHEKKPLSEIKPTDDLSMGLLTEDHADTCTPADREEGCDCEKKEFSWDACDGCGSNDGGDRYGMTLVHGVR